MTSLRINTCVSTIRSIYDETGKYLPSGNYYFTINEITNNNIKGILKNRRINSEYIFSCKKILKMMSNAQSRLIDFTDLRKEDYMPQYSFPITSNNNYFTGEYIAPEISRTNNENQSRYVVNYYDSIIRRNNRILSQPPYYTNPSRYNPFVSQINRNIRQPTRNNETNRQPTRNNETNRQPTRNNEVQNKCSICWEQIQGNSKTLLCNHKFHRNCINTWLNQSTTCPLCRREVVSSRTNRNRIIRNNIITHSVIFEEIV